jgi:hypothetical protein
VFGIAATRAIGEACETVRFVHYSDQPLTCVSTCSQNGSDSRDGKPVGLWLSILEDQGRDSWRETCAAQSILFQSKYATEVILKQDARILWLCCAADIDALTVAHGYFPETREGQTDHGRSAVHWNCVAEKFDGVIAVPYCLERQAPLHWYKTWCCASGCIWSPDSVAELKPVDFPR